MTYDQRAVEVLAVNAVKDNILISDFLGPYIAENDKEPSWDGFVYIYKDKVKRKDNIIGRVPTQVKGTVVCGDFSKKEISFQMPKADLKNYLYDGGALLFVVYIDSSNGLNRKIYYASLTPIKLRKLIKDADEQDSKSVKLKEFPQDNNKKATICLNCLRDCHRQSSFTDAKLYTLDELQKNGQLNGLRIFVSAIGEKDVKTAFLSNDVYIYADIKGCSIPQPLEMIIQEKQTLETISSNVSVGGCEMYSQYKVIRTENTTTIQIGESVRISNLETEGEATIKYKNSNMLRVRAKDLEFMISCMEYGSFCMGDVTLPLDYDSVNTSGFDIESQKEHLRELKESVQALDMLGYTNDLDINKMEIEDACNLRRLVIAFVHKKPVTNLNPNLPPIARINIGNANFLLYLKLNEEEKGTYELYDFFKTELNIEYEMNGARFSTSQYVLLKAKEILELCNLRTGVLLPSFQKIDRNKDTHCRATLFMLELLKAYDMSGGKRKDILDTAFDFADWLDKIAETQDERNISKINLFQTVKRKRPLNIMEISILYQMLDDSLISKKNKVAIYLLLDAKEIAHHQFDMLDYETKKELRDYPIYHFW